MVWARGQLCFLSAVAVIAEVCPRPRCRGLGGPYISPVSWFGGPCVSGLPPVSWFGSPCVSPLPSGVHDCCPGASSCGVRRGRGDLQSVVTSLSARGLCRWAETLPCLISPAPGPGARWEGSRGTRLSAGGGAPAKSFPCHVSS